MHKIDPHAVRPKRSRTSLFLAAVSMTLVAPAPAQQRPAPADVVVNMRGVEIADVAEQISRITGRTLVLDPNVKGQVNVTSAEPLTPQGVWDLFLSVLRVHGFAAVRSGSAWRIIPQAAAVRDGGVAGPIGGQEMVTRLIRLPNVPGEAAARVFRPLVAAFGSVEALASPNAIVVTDYAENVRRIERLARSLDGGGGGGFEIIKLGEANARDVATAIQAIMGDASRVVADERSNSVIVRGDATMVEEARRLAGALDRTGAATPTTRVFRLSNADAESVTDVLRGLMGEGEPVTNLVARSLPRTRDYGRLGQNGGAGVMAAPPQGPLGAAKAAPAPLPEAGPENTPRGFATADLVVQPAPEINAVVVRGAPSAIAAIEPLITELDVRRPQVMIEAAIVEITGDEAEALGVQLGLGAAAIDRADGAATSFSNLGLPLRSVLTAIGAPAGAVTLTDGLSANVRVADDFSILVQALGQSTRANLLSTPSLTTLDNQPAEIVVGQNVPFRTGNFTTDGNSLNPFTTIEREDVGITLRVVPRVHRGDVVRLEVSQEVSSLVGAVSGAADLITNRRSIQTTVLADNGQTIVLGGLITDDRMKLRTQVPILGNIPLVGELFKSRRDSQTKRTLFVFLKPTILRDRDAASAVTEGKYARLRGEEQAWDQRRSLLVEPPQPRLTLEIKGIY
jgi:general secretion pathway protein D